MSFIKPEHFDDILIIDYEGLDEYVDLKGKIATIATVPNNPAVGDVVIVEGNPDPKNPPDFIQLRGYIKVWPHDEIGSGKIWVKDAKIRVYRSEEEERRWFNSKSPIAKEEGYELDPTLEDRKTWQRDPYLPGTVIE